MNVSNLLAKCTLDTKDPEFSKRMTDFYLKTGIYKKSPPVHEDQNSEEFDSEWLDEDIILSDLKVPDYNEFNMELNADG